MLTIWFIKIKNRVNVNMFEFINTFLKLVVMFKFVINVVKIKIMLMSTCLNLMITLIIWFIKIKNHVNVVMFKFVVNVVNLVYQNQNFTLMLT